MKSLRFWAPGMARSPESLGPGPSPGQWEQKRNQVASQASLWPAEKPVALWPSRPGRKKLGVPNPAAGLGRPTRLDFFLGKNLGVLIFAPDPEALHAWWRTRRRWSPGC